MWHTIFIALHAATGGTALLAGCVTIGRRALFGIYLWSLVAMEVFLGLAIAAEWALLDAATRVLFASFLLLGLFLLWRADQARRIRPTGSAAPSVNYVAHIGFTLVALFDAFIVILVLNSGTPLWLVAAVGVLIAVAGHFALGAVRERLTGSTGDQPVFPLIDGRRRARAGHQELRFRRLTRTTRRFAGRLRRSLFRSAR